MVLGAGGALLVADTPVRDGRWTATSHASTGWHGSRLVVVVLISDGDPPSRAQDHCNLW